MSAAAKHTPGPWTAKPPRIGAAITVYGPDGEFPVATTCSNTSPATMQAHRDGTVAANARLIAAAPEQHELLATFTEWARQVASREDIPRGVRSMAATLADDGRRLIAKATGVQS